MEEGETGERNNEARKRNESAGADSFAPGVDILLRLAYPQGCVDPSATGNPAAECGNVAERSRDWKVDISWQKLEFRLLGIMLLLQFNRRLIIASLNIPQRSTTSEAK